MKIAAIKRIIREDFPREYQGLMDKLLYPLNQFMESVGLALSNNLTIRDNMAAQEITIEVSSLPTVSDPISFKSTLNGPCRGIICINVDNQTDNTVLSGAPFLTFENSGSQVRITNITGLTNGKRYLLTLYCFS